MGEPTTKHKIASTPFRYDLRGRSPRATGVADFSTIPVGLQKNSHALSTQPGTFPREAIVSPHVSLHTTCPTQIVFYDAECAFCCRCVLWLALRDSRKGLRFAALGGRTAKQLLRVPPAQEPDSLIYWNRRGPVYYAKGVLCALEALDFPWPWVARILRRVPNPLSKAVYRCVARVRKRVIRTRPCGAALSLPESLPSWRLLP